jgi:hypothetical protein
VSRADDCARRSSLHVPEVREDANQGRAFVLTAMTPCGKDFNTRPDAVSTLYL